MTLSEFFAMGGHGLYVWWSYGLFVGGLLGLGLLYRVQRIQVIKQIQRLAKREAAQQEVEDHASKA